MRFGSRAEEPGTGRGAGRQRGFSLLELLLVLLIVGLLSALSVAWLDGGQAPVRQALEQLASESRVQAARARHAGQMLGLRWNGKQPEFVRLHLDNGQAKWRVEPARLSRWPTELRADWAVTAEPQVVFSPSGLARTAVLNWSWPQGHEQWHWQADSGLQVAVQAVVAAP